MRKWCTIRRMDGAVESTFLWRKQTMGETPQTGNCNLSNYTSENTHRVAYHPQFCAQHNTHDGRRQWHSKHVTAICFVCNNTYGGDINYVRALLRLQIECGFACVEGEYHLNTLHVISKVLIVSFELLSKLD